MYDASFGSELSGVCDVLDEGLSYVVGVWAAFDVEVDVGWAMYP